MAPRASFRLLRTGSIASVIVALGAGGHLAGGGSLPEPAILVALCALTVLPVAVATKFRLSLPVLAGLLGAGQVWLHWAFHNLSATAPAGLQGPPAGHAQHALLPETGSFGAAAPTDTLTGDGKMFLAHVLATVVTSVVLSRGEQALWALAGWLRPLAKLPVPVAIVPARTPGRCAAVVVLPGDQIVPRIPSRRGPPLMAAAA